MTKGQSGEKNRSDDDWFDVDINLFTFIVNCGLYAMMSTLDEN